jgi:hypothetical protein
MKDALKQDKMSKVTAEKWQDSNAKDILTLLILDGTVTEASDLDEVYELSDEFEKFNKAKFKRNAKALLDALDKKEERALFDSTAVAHDRMLHPRPELTSGGYPFWDTSEAKELLTSDIENGVDKTMTSRELWHSREAYKQFPRDIFIKHIHQERKSIAQRELNLLNKKKKKKNIH